MERSRCRFLKAERRRHRLFTVQKPPPVYDVDLVLHPEEDQSYFFFEGAATNTFQANPPGGIPRVNAWWLAETSLVAYQEAPRAAAIFNAAELQCEPLVSDSTEAYVVYGSDFVVAVFRGTQPDQWKDIVTDVQMALVPWPTGGLVHRGFRAALDSIWPALTDSLSRLSAGRTVWFAGHSHGAALATLAADLYPGTRGVCTFGSPRVGDPTFAAALTAKFAMRMLRFVNNHDIVTHVPPPLFGYTHIDLRRLIARDGTISNQSPTLQHFFSTLIGAPEQLLTLVKAIEDGTSGFTPSFLLDHMPKAYAIWTWNDFDVQT